MKELLSALDRAEASELHLRTLKAAILSVGAAHGADSFEDMVVDPGVTQRVIGTWIAADIDSYHFFAEQEEGQTTHCHHQPSNRDLHQVDTSLS